MHLRGPGRGVEEGTSGSMAGAQGLGGPTVLGLAGAQLPKATHRHHLWSAA